MLKWLGNIIGEMFLSLLTIYSNICPLCSAVLVVHVDPLNLSFLNLGFKPNSMKMLYMYEL